MKKLLIPLNDYHTYTKYSDNLEEFSEGLAKIQMDNKISEAIISISEGTRNITYLPKFEIITKKVRDIFETLYIKKGDTSILRSHYYKGLSNYSMFDIYTSEVNKILAGETSLKAEVPSVIVANYGIMDAFLGHFGSVERVLDFIFNESNIEKVFCWGNNLFSGTGRFSMPEGAEFHNVKDWNALFYSFNPKDFSLFLPYSDYDVKTPSPHTIKGFEQKKKKEIVESEKMVEAW